MTRALKIALKVAITILSPIWITAWGIGYVLGCIGLHVIGGVLSYFFMAWMFASDLVDGRKAKP